MNRIIIFDPDVSGHHLEFNVNLLKESGNIEKELIFVLGYKFKELSQEHYAFHKNSVNHKVVFIPKWCDIILGYTKSSNLRSLFYTLLSLFYIKHFKVDQIIYLYINSILRFNILLPRKISISGILFSPINFIQINSFIKIRIFEKFINQSRLKSLFILNDKKTTEAINHNYGSNKVQFIPDPVSDLKINDNNIRKSEDIVLLFLGGITERKGILNSVQSLIHNDSILKEKIEIRIVGKVSLEYKKKFYDEINHLLKKELSNIKIKLIDKFIPVNDFFLELRAADYVMLTYDMSNASSGILGYSMLYNKEIFATNQGFFKDQINDYKLGYLVPSDLTELSAFFSKFKFKKSYSTSLNAEYLNEHSFYVFLDKLLTN